MDDLPYVLQFNKRDIQDVAPTNYLEYLLNKRRKRVRSYESVASTGFNVFATLDYAAQLLLHKFNRENKSLAPPFSTAKALGER